MATEDVIVIGGSYAGIAAALQLARARRRVTVIDAGQRRNRFAAAAHGLLGQDGRAPGAIVEDARAQLLAYPTVTWREDTVGAARADGDEFEVELASGERLAARRLVLAAGLVDVLPDLPGLAERWGTSVFHCPYCHGYELAGGELGVLATGPVVEHLAKLLPDWGPTTLFVQGVELDAITRTAIAARGVTIEDEPVVALAGDPPGVEVRLRDGRALALAGVFVLPEVRMADGLAEQLGCELEEGVAGLHLVVNDTGETNVSGVFACGDLAIGGGSISTAVGEGARTGVAVHKSLVFR